MCMGALIHVYHCDDTLSLFRVTSVHAFITLSPFIMAPYLNTKRKHVVGKNAEDGTTGNSQTANGNSRECHYHYYIPSVFSLHRLGMSRITIGSSSRMYRLSPSGGYACAAAAFPRAAGYSEPARQGTPCQPLRSGRYGKNDASAIDFRPSGVRPGVRKAPSEGVGKARRRDGELGDSPSDCDSEGGPGDRNSSILVGSAAAAAETASRRRRTAGGLFVPDCAGHAPHGIECVVCSCDGGLQPDFPSVQRFSSALAQLLTQ